jgi:hypothetical protein
MSIVSALRCAMRLVASGASVEQPAVGLTWGMNPDRRAAARSWAAAMHAFNDALPDIDDGLPTQKCSRPHPWPRRGGRAHDCASLNAP